MANATNRQIQFSISCNAQQPKKEIEALKKLEDDLLTRRKELIAQGETEGKNWNMVKTALRDVRKEIRTAEDNYETLQKVIADLSNSSLPQLKKAFKEGQKAISQMSENNANLKPMQAALQEIQRQMDIITGKAKNVAKEIGDIDKKSDGWLASSKRDLQNYIASLDEVDDHYKEQLKLLGKIEAEEKKRADARRASEQKRAQKDLKQQAREAERRANTGDYAGLSQNEIEAGKKAMVDYQKTLEFGSQRWQEYGEAIGRAEEKLNSFKQKQESMTVQQARDLITNKDATSSQLREARSTIATARENTPTSNTTQITEFDKMLQQIDDRLDAVNGKVKKTEISWQQMRKVMADPKGAIGEDIKKTMDAIQQRIAKLPAGSRAVELLRAEYAKLEKTLKGTETRLVNVNDVIARAKQGRASIEELKQAYKQLEAELNKIKDLNGSAFKNGQKDLKNLKKLIDETTGSVNKQGGAFQTALRNIAAYGGVFTVFSKIKEMITGVIKKNLELSDSLADIRKVSGLAMQEINQMAVNLSKIDTRTTVQELNRIAYSGAKLGIGDMGVEALESFTRAANQVNVALKEDLGDEALTSLSKITQVMGLIPEMGVEQAMLRTGSAIFKLASTSTASSPKIIDFSNRLLSMGKQGALSTADILALGAAVDSMALEPEVASTAFNKMIVEIRKGTTSLESDLGIAQGRLKELVESGKGMQAIQEIFHKMHETKNVFALDGLFKDMGSEGGARMVKTMVTMANSVDILDKAVKNSNKAFQEGIAITEEYEIQQNTAQGLLERANNLWEKAFINPDGVDSVKELAKAWYDVSKSLTENEAAMGSIKFSLAAIGESIKLLLYILPGLIAAFAFKGIATVVLTLKSALFGVGEASIFAAGGVRKLNAAMKANWISLIIGLVVELIHWLWELASESDKASEGMEKFDKTLKKADEDIAVETANLKMLTEQINNATVGTKARQAAIDTFNNKFGSYLSKLLTEKSTMEDVARAYEQAAAAIREKAYQENMAEDLRTHYYPRVRWAVNYKREFDDLSGGLGNWLEGWTDDHNRLNFKLDGKNHIVYTLADQIYKQTGTKPNVDRVISAIKDNTDLGLYGNQTTTKDVINVIAGKPNVSKSDQMLHKGLKYIMQQRSAENVRKEIQDTYKIKHKDVGLATPQPVNNGSGGGTPSGPANRIDKPNNTSNTVTSDPAAKAKSDLDQILANLKAYYDLQTAALTEQLAYAEATETEQQIALDEFAKHRQRAFNAISASLSLGTDAYEQYKKTLEADLKAGKDDAQSVYLLTNLLSANLSQIRTDMQKDKEVTKYIEKFTKIRALRPYVTKKGKPGTRMEDVGIAHESEVKRRSYDRQEAFESYVANLVAKAAGETKKTSQTDLKRMNAVRKEILEHDYTGFVDKNTVNGLELLGFVEINPDSPEVEKYRKSVTDTFKHVRKNIVDVISADPTNRENFLTVLFGADYEKALQDSPFSRLLKAGEDEMKLFYLKLIQYNDEYVQAMKKRSDEQKKVVNYLWSVNRDKKTLYDSPIEQYQQWNDIYGKQPTGSQKYGFTGVNLRIRDYKPKYSPEELAKIRKKDAAKADKLQFEQAAEVQKFNAKEVARVNRDKKSDPELYLLQLRKEEAEAYYQFVIERTNDELLIEEAQKKVREAMIEQIKKEAAIIKERVAAINSFMEPTYDAIEEMGNVWVKFRESAESGQAAMLDNLRNFIKQYAVMMIKGFRDMSEKKVKDALLEKKIYEDNPKAEKDKSVKKAKPSFAGVDEGDEFMLDNVVDDLGRDQEYITSGEDGPKFKSKLRNLKAVSEGENLGVGGEYERVETDEQEKVAEVKNEAIQSVLAPEEIEDTTALDLLVAQNESILDATMIFHKQMLEEESKYQDAIQKIREGGDKAAILEEYEKKSEMEVQLNGNLSKMKLDARKKFFATLKNLDAVGWNNIFQVQKTHEEQKTDLATTAEEGITDTEKENQDKRAQQSEQASAQSIDQMVSETVSKVVLGIAGGSAKTVSELGWWGIPLVGVISAALMGLLNYALSFIGKGSSNAKAAPNTKLVSGMLTYDNGNVQDLKPFMGADGNIYYATEDNTAHRGVNLLTKPTATTINGQPSLVAENGPELVIGRETTAAMMQNNPALLKAIYQFDRNHSSRALYDAGNLAALAASSADVAVNTQGNLIAESTQSNIALMTAINALLARLEQPINAKIDMYGRGNLYDSMGKAQAFMKGK